MNSADYEIVIGLEVHAELATKTKLFSASPNLFGGEPNTHIDPVSLGLPGSLPVLNEKAVELAVRVGLALGSEIRPCTFARKNYFYPDMPKDFQISQYDHPLNAGGTLQLPSGKKIRILRAHLEEDTGKITHIGGGGRIHDAKYSLIDYNRAGVPLLEIVSEPDISSAEEAKDYVTELRSILIALGASDGKMEEGSLRVDCNVSVKPTSQKELGTRCEIKNVNSLRSLGRAIEYEAARHIKILEGQTGEGAKKGAAGERIIQETRHFNEDTGETHSLRSKEGEVDYRYFPEPDLVPLELDENWIEKIRSELPPLPAERRKNLMQISGCDEPLAALFTRRGQDELVAQAITIAAGAEVDSETVLKLAEQNLAEGSGELTPTALAKAAGMAKTGEVSSTQVKKILEEAVKSGGDPKAIAADMGFEAMDSGELKPIVAEIVANNPDEWERYKGGDEKLAGFFVGQVMKATGGKADGKAVTAILNKLQS